MKTAAILLATLGFAVAGSAMAYERISDVDYLKANRCRGLAAGLGANDTASLDSLIKTESRSRLDIVYDWGQQEMERAKREAASSDGRDRHTAELTGYCTAFMGGGGSGRETAKSR
jgi:hypothetical protein